MSERESEEVFKQDATVARLVLVFPASPALIPVFEGFLQMKLHRVDKLTVNAFDHHLVPAEV